MFINDSVMWDQEGHRSEDDDEDDDGGVTWSTDVSAEAIKRRAEVSISIETYTADIAMLSMEYQAVHTIGVVLIMCADT